MENGDWYAIFSVIATVATTMAGFLLIVTIWMADSYRNSPNDKDKMGYIAVMKWFLISSIFMMSISFLTVLGTINVPKDQSIAAAYYVLIVVLAAISIATAIMGLYEFSDHFGKKEKDLGSENSETIIKE